MANLNQIYYHTVGSKIYKCELIKITPASTKKTKTTKGEDRIKKTPAMYYFKPLRECHNDTDSSTISLFTTEDTSTYFNTIEEAKILIIKKLNNKIEEVNNYR